MMPQSKATKLAGAEQLSDIAFNLYGHAIEDKIMVDAAGEKIRMTALPRSSKLLKDSGDVKLRSDLNFTAKETQAANGSTTMSYMLVGYTCLYVINNRKTYEAAPDDGAKHKAQAVGIKTPKSMLEWGETEWQPIYVVTPFLDKPLPDGQGIALLGLVNPQNDLCQAYIVPTWSVFYRAEFRSNHTNIKNRTARWNKIVADHSVQSVSVPSATSGKAAAIDMGKVIKLPFESFVLELYKLTIALRSDPKNKNIRSQLVKLMDDKDKDFLHRPLTDDASIEDFADIEVKELDDDQASAMVEAIGKQWPSIESVTAARLKLLKRAFAVNNEAINDEALPALLAEGMHRLAQAEAVSQDLNDDVLMSMGGDIIATVARISGASVPRSAAPIASGSDDESKEGQLLGAIAAKLREMVAAFDGYHARSKAAFGDDVFKARVGPWDAWSRLGKQPDVDSAKLMYADGMRSIIGSTRAATEEYMKTAREIVDLLETLGY